MIDGQQRLACVALLFAAMANHLLRSGDGQRSGLISDKYLRSQNITTLENDPKLQLGEYDNEFFRSLMESAILDEALPSPNVRVESQVLLKDAYEYFLEQIRLAFNFEMAGWKSRLLELKDFLHESVESIAVLVGEDQNAYLIFETLNDRGLRLSASDLLKNYLFSQAGDRLNEVRLHWANMMNTLADIPGDDAAPTFLRHYWISTRGPVRQRELYRTITGNLRDQ